MTMVDGKRKKRSDSAEDVVDNLLAASEPAPECPAHVALRDGDRPFWDGVVSARARRDWTPAELVVAAQLARTQADIEVVSKELDTEGVSVTNARGTRVLNPKVTVLEQLARRQMALMRALRMGGLTGEGRDLTVKRNAERAAEDLKREVAEDDALLAT